jgi:hypothetical protein
MEVLGYFWFPLAVIVGYLGLGLVAGYVYSLVGLKSNIIASGATAVLSNVWELLLELAIVRMQVKLYMQLTKSGPELTPAG